MLLEFISCITLDFCNPKCKSFKTRDIDAGQCLSLVRKSHEVSRVDHEGSEFCMKPASELSQWMTK